MIEFFKTWYITVTIKNPCKKCLIKACCSENCYDRNEYERVLGTDGQWLERLLAWFLPYLILVPILTVIFAIIKPL